MIYFLLGLMVICTIYTILSFFIIIINMFFKNRYDFIKHKKFNKVYKKISSEVKSNEYVTLRREIFNNTKEKILKLGMKEEKEKFIKFEKERIANNSKIWSYSDNKALVAFIPIYVVFLKIFIPSTELDNTDIILYISILLVIAFVFYFYDKRQSDNNNKVVCGQIYLSVLEEIEKDSNIMSGKLNEQKEYSVKINNTKYYILIEEELK